MPDQRQSAPTASSARLKKYYQNAAREAIEESSLDIERSRAAVTAAAAKVAAQNAKSHESATSQSNTPSDKRSGASTSSSIVKPSPQPKPAVPNQPIPQPSQAQKSSSSVTNNTGTHTNTTNDTQNGQQAARAAFKKIQESASSGLTNAVSDGSAAAAAAGKSSQDYGKTGNGLTENDKDTRVKATVGNAARMAAKASGSSSPDSRRAKAAPDNNGGASPMPSSNPSLAESALKAAKATSALHTQKEDQDKKDREKEKETNAGAALKAAKLAGDEVLSVIGSFSKSPDVDILTDKETTSPYFADFEWSSDVQSSPEPKLLAPTPRRSMLPKFELFRSNSAENANDNKGPEKQDKVSHKALDKPSIAGPLLSPPKGLTPRLPSPAATHSGAIYETTRPSIPSRNSANEIDTMLAARTADKNIVISAVEPAIGQGSTTKSKRRGDSKKDNKSNTTHIRTTMRKERKFNEEKPWKYHGFALTVSESERKRYEGLWATNKGIHVPYLVDDILASILETNRQPLDEVHGLVVRELWRRSRLPESSLEHIWDLVDRNQKGSLDREEFLVGTWLVDQSLYGRKVPDQLRASIWNSVSRLNVHVRLDKHHHHHHPHHHSEETKKKHKKWG
uniref:ARAD1D28644p n=1 Tax=Blastobotrys adeninivorans TaxID=409370 RepID=A0A060TGA8_BLAAD